MFRDFIGVFDSGVGGISVLRELVKLMPNENYVYFGDSANAPYGEKTVEEVRSLTIKNIEYLIGLGAKAVVVACNTATSASIEDLRHVHGEIPVIGIEPAIKPAVEYKENSRILVMATAVTLREAKFKNLVSHFSQKADIIPLACHKLAELVEAGEIESRKTYDYLKEILSPYIGNTDSIVLGCTHYPFVKKIIKEIMGDGVKLFDGGEGTAKETMRRIIEYNTLSQNQNKGEIVFINSLNSEEINVLSEKLLYHEKKD